MLSNKFLFAGIFLFLTLFAAACGDSPDEKKNHASLKDYRDPSVQHKEAKSVLGENVKVTYFGKFKDNKEEEIIAGTEINTKDEWGIKFTSIDISGKKPEKIFETGLLEGSFSNGHTEKMNLPSLDYELIYYSSGDYFLGSGGGEVYSYIINFNEREVYYAHLVVYSKKISLYISENIINDDIKNFFINTFKKDFSSLELVTKDIEYVE